MLDRPVFTLDIPNPNPNLITDALWWLWLRLKELEPSSLLSGIYANKPGFHNTGNANEVNWPGNYSIRDMPNRRGPWWRTKASAIDWTFPNAQRGDYSTIDRYTSRLMLSARNESDPRLDLVLYEFFGQDDNDRVVEGWNEYRDEASTSDSSHLWHIHKSILRDKCGDYWAMWALLTVLMGWSVAQWQATLPVQPPTTPPASETDWTTPLMANLPVLRKGSNGDAVRRLQGLLLSHNWHLGLSFMDGDFGPMTENAVKRFQINYSLSADGIVGQRTWTTLLTR